MNFYFVVSACLPSYCGRYLTDFIVNDDEADVLLRFIYFIFGREEKIEVS